MGRIKRYITEEEQIRARKERQMKYYWKNHEEKKKKNLERYYRVKEEVSGSSV